MKRKIPFLPCALLALPLAHLTAQTVQPPAAPAGGEIIELSPFTVDASKDKGYRAENTLAGSRLNTALRDTAAPVSVFTEEFLQDLAITNVDQLIEYSVGTQLDVQDSGPGTDANNHIGGANIVRRFDIRGIRASESLDYFRSITPNDGYRVGRYDESRGPNGILFGVSSAGGLINQSSTLATTNRDSGRLSYQLGNNDTHRAEVLFNKVIVPKKLAVAVAAIDQENGGWREPDFQDKERLFATLTFTPTDRITIRATGERGNDYFARVAPYGLSESAFAWLDNRNARGVPATTFVPSGANPTAAQQALGITTRNQAATGQRFVYVQNDGVTFNSAGTLLTGTYNNPVVRAPDGSAGVSGGALRINDPKFLPYDINSGGPGMYRDQELANYTFTLDWRITDDLNLNLAHNYQYTALRNPALTGAEPQLRGEPNRTLGVNGPANPYAGQLYIEGQWRDADHSAWIKESRLSLSYDIDFERIKWLGSHRLAGMVSRSEETDRFIGKRLALIGAPFNNDPVNQANRITTRVYVDESNPRGFIAPDWRKVPATTTIAGRTYNIGWVNDNAGTQNAMTTQELDTRLLVLQSYFFNRKLVTVFGYREDTADFISFGHSVNPATREEVVDLSKRSTDSVKGITRTQGVVYHARDWLSLTANWSTNIGIPTFQNRLLPDGKIPPPTEGESQDYGFALDLLDRRLSIKAVRYQTDERGQTRSGGIDAEFNQRNIRIAQALETALVGPGRRYSAAEWAPIRSSLTPTANAIAFDVESEGYELSIVANPTPNWRILANYSYTDRIRSNGGGRDALPWYGFTEANGLLVEAVTQNANGTYTVNPAALAAGGTAARWVELGGQHPDANVATLVTSTGITVAQDMLDLIRFFNEDRQEEEQRWGLRPHKVSVFTSYDFTEGRLRGFTVGGGYRWREANIIGQNASGGEIRGRILSAADLMLRYRHKLDVWRVKGTMSHQINVSNLFDRDGIMPQRFSSTPDFAVPGGRGVGYSRFDFIDPRSIRFTTTFSF
jgi:iron complex outermembrane receptor protein